MELLFLLTWMAAEASAFRGEDLVPDSDIAEEVA